MLWIGFAVLAIAGLVFWLWQSTSAAEPAPEAPPATAPKAANHQAPRDREVGVDVLPPDDPRSLDPLAVRPLHWHAKPNGKLYALAFPRDGFADLDAFSAFAGVHMDTLLRLAAHGPDGEGMKATPPIGLDVPALPELSLDAFSDVFDTNELDWLRSPTWERLQGRFAETLTLIAGQSAASFVLFFAIPPRPEPDVDPSLHPHLVAKPELDPMPFEDRFAHWRGKQVEPLRSIEHGDARIELFDPETFPDLAHFIAFASQRDRDVGPDELIDSLRPHHQVPPEEIGDLALSIHSSGFSSLRGVFEALVATTHEGDFEWFGAHPTGFVYARRAPEKQESAADLLAAMKKQKSGNVDPWKQARNQLGGLVLGAADRERVWRRAHRGITDEHRPLVEIVDPTPAEIQRLQKLVRELEVGR